MNVQRLERYIKRLRVPKSKYRYWYLKIIGAIPSHDIEVHHIDGNRLNNSVFNLVSLPKKLHKDYHSLFQMSGAYLVLNYYGDSALSISYQDFKEMVNLDISRVDREILELKKIKGYRQNTAFIYANRKLSNYGQCIQEHKKYSIKKSEILKTIEKFKSLQHNIIRKKHDKLTT